MVSRETTIQIGAGVLAVLVLLAAAAFDVGISGPAGFLVQVLWLGLAMGGAHLYLAVRNHDGTVPVGTRWRFLAALVLHFIAIGAIVIGLHSETTIGYVVSAVGSAVVVATIVGYFVFEAIDGYRASRSE
ncbi:MAG TPA: hypothetical protein VJ898_12485 [Natrialbaceae archaeon]|nr:hypothetical protein [Natrialbaceae archaeon]